MTPLLDLGLKPYEEVLNLQKELRVRRQSGEIGNTLIFCQHPPVFTVGKQDCTADFLSSSDKIREDGIEIAKVDRGGRITYHGPGQLVVYFIVRVEDICSGVKEFVSRIEDICIDVISGFGLSPSRKKEYPGIWIGDKKIAAIGLNVSRGVTMHGMAINVDPDLEHYKHIVPCGIKGHDVTSLAREMGSAAPGIEEVKEGIIKGVKSGDVGVELCSGSITVPL